MPRRTLRALSSPRFRRRLARGAVLASVVSAGVVVSVLFWNTADPPPSHLSDRPAQIFQAPLPVKLAPPEKRELIAVAARFLETAVKRQHTEIAYDLVSPSLRAGTTRRQWVDGGEIPVIPYPVDAARWKFDYSFPDEVGLQVLVFPETKSDFEPMVFNMSLRAVSAGSARRWLIDSWTPRAGSGARQSRSEGSPFQIAVPENGERVSARLGVGWLLLPVLLLFTGALLVPVGFLVLGRQQNRRAQRAYEASRN
ncbi:MAG: hypothetical protein H0W14_01090 [Actinobacteria bacterium]|nr:hypothetical protein [Actinomycetota bacterium]